MASAWQPTRRCGSTAVGKGDSKASALRAALTVEAGRGGWVDAGESVEMEAEFEGYRSRQDDAKWQRGELSRSVLQVGVAAEVEGE